MAQCRVHGIGQAERVVAPGDRLVRKAELEAFEQRRELGGRVELRERIAEPLAVRRVAALEEEAEPHHVVREASGDDPRAELVADLRRSADERLLL